MRLTILGCYAATPRTITNPTAQVLEIKNRLFLIDCGEGTQVQLRKNKIKFSKINHIFISHLHGDHFFGLVGLISTMRLMGRDKDLTIYGPKGLEQIVRMQLEIGGSKLDFAIQFIELNGDEACMLFEDGQIEIHTFPLKHRIPTNGFLIREKPRERKLLSDKISGSGMRFEHMHLLKKGEDVFMEDGHCYKNQDFTADPRPPRSYAYCSDTLYAERVIPYIQEVSLLYHEATFIEKDIDRARATYHSTARQAGEIAKKASVGKLLIGHLSARYDDGQMHVLEAQSVFPETGVVEDGMVISIE